MKPIFGVDKTTKTNNSEQFIVDSISEGFSFEDIMINPPEDSAKTKLFKKLKIVLACIAIPLTMLVCFAGIKEINWLMLTAFIVLLPFIGVFLYLTFSVEASDNSKNNETYEYLLLAQQDKVQRALSVPEEAHDIEVLRVIYKKKGNDIVFKAKSFGVFNEQMKIYFKDDNYDTLYLSDLYNVYAFKVSNFKRIEKVDKQIKLFNWYRDDITEDFEKENYLYVDFHNKITLTSFMSIKYDNGTEELDLLLPWYEYPTICEFTLLSYTEEK